ncbi:Phosphatidylinositol 4-kinase gamma 3 [Raphanus sativus]|nr:Phosphatidylinositol 4-kinase gamma 3 [Raphanus sativus]
MVGLGTSLIFVPANEKLLHLVIKLSDLQAICLKTFGGKVVELFVERSRSVGYVKQKLSELGSSAWDHGLTLDGEELDDEQRLVITDLYFFVEPLVVNREIELTSLLKELISSTIEGLEKGNAPIKSSDGSGGAYFMQDQSGHKYVSVFKPIDEEPMAVNNPHGQPLSIDGEGLKKGTQVGEGAFREVAAYILDYPMTGPRTFSSDQPGFSGVPPTAMVKCLHKDFNHPNGYSFSHENAKIGSLQMFVSNVGTCEDMGYGVFPVDQVHKISVLDIRLANADRHGGNILVSRDGNDGQIVLTPIDHGYCFPNKFEDCTFEWLYWPQAKEPYSSETLEYIKTLDAEQDIELLRFHGWEIPSSCARVFRVSTMLLKKGAGQGLTPFAIGSIMCRETLEKESVIEQIIYDAEAIVSPETTEEAFISTVSAIMDRYLDQYSLN